MTTYFGQPVRIVTAITNWPSLGITPSNPRLALRTTGGKLIATAHAGSADASRAELIDYCNSHHLVLTKK